MAVKGQQDAKQIKMQGYTSGVPIDTDPTLAADSDLLVASQKAIKTYVDAAEAAAQAAAIAASQPLDADLTAYANAADAAARRALIGLGTAATANTGTGASDVPTITQADARYIQLARAPFSVPIFPNTGTNITWTNMPAALTFFNAVSRWYVGAPCTYVTQVMLNVVMAGTGGFAGSKIRLLYRTQAAGWDATVGNWNQLGSAAQVQATITSTGTTFLATSGWIDIATLAKDEILVMATGLDGDGIVDPQFNSIIAYFR